MEIAVICDTFVDKMLNSSVRLERKSHPHSLHKFLPHYPVGGILLRTIEAQVRGFWIKANTCFHRKSKGDNKLKRTQRRASQPFVNLKS